MNESDSGFSNGSGMDLDSAFASIPKNKSCLLVWRVEVCYWNQKKAILLLTILFYVFVCDQNFKLVAVPREWYGTFFKGDAYVLYHAEEIKKSTGLSSTSPANLIQHIHFWIGAEATQDEAGVAAYKTVELGRIYFVD